MNYSFFDFLTLIGSLALFLYGMKVMSDSLMEVAGDKMRNILASMTSNRVLAVFTGFLITAIIQSSSATTLMVVSFVNASLLTLVESVGVIMGANIGTTVTAWIITILGFKISMSTIALPLVAIGFLLTFAKSEKAKHWGGFVIGFAVLFIGLQFLKDAVPNLKENPQMLEWLKGYTDLKYISVLIFLLIGTILTVVIQSSSATMALTLVMCNEGWIPFDMAAAMVLGENIGTTITANLAALVANQAAKRTARAHLIFNVMGVVWMLILFYPFLDAVDWLVTSKGNASPFASAVAVPVALSTFHTAFNIINTSLLIWFLPLIVKIVKKMVPISEIPEPEVDKPKYLSAIALDYPQTAVKALIDESKRLYEGPVFEIVAHVMNIHREDIKSEQKIKKIVKESTKIVNINVDEVYYNKVKNIYSQIIEFASHTQNNFHLSKRHNNTINNLKIANRKMAEIVKDCNNLNENMMRYVDTDNIYMRKAYDKIRKRVAKLLREIYLASTDESHKGLTTKIRQVRSKIKDNDVLTDGSLNSLIRNNQIDSQMATSLANDSIYANDISKNLVDIAELLYVQDDTLIKEFKKIKIGKRKKAS